MSTLTPYAAIYFSAQIINELASQRRPEELLRWTVLTVTVTGLMSLGSCLLLRWNAYERSKFTYSCWKMLADKFYTMDFADIDRQRTHDLYSQIEQSRNFAGWGLNKLPWLCQMFCQAIAGIFGAVALTVSLFTQPVPESAGALTVLNQPLFLLAFFGVMLLFIALGSDLETKAMSLFSKTTESGRLGNRIFSHFCFVGMDNSQAGADIRMYNQVEMAEAYGKSANAFTRNSDYAKLLRGAIGISESVSSGLSSLFAGLVYVFVCLKAWGGAFGIGSVTQYVGAVTALSENVKQLLTGIGEMRSNAAFLRTTYEFLDIPNAMYQGSLTTEKRSDREYDVEFQDVSFKYPGAETWALRHVSMKFQVGKRLAIVGENGSGKTTFIKLLCRLYDPQEGKILLNGIDIRKYNYRDYMDIFSVVFQDFQLLSQPLGCNVAGSVQYDRARAEKCLVDAGFGERLKTMPEGLDTYLYRDFGKEGVQISGGEAQKIAIARALYKDAPFIVLDEPTAALDPIAEAEIYEKFDAIAGDKTAIYISHRLSSCKFCDEIAVFDHGAVIQQGTHEALVSDERGKYYALWNAQAQYYTEEDA